MQLWGLYDLLRTDEVGQVQRYSHAIRFTPDGHTVYRGSADGSIRRWDATDPTRPIPMPERLAGHDRVVGAVDISADGRLLASGSDDRTVRLWDISDPARPEPARRAVRRGHQLHPDRGVQPGWPGSGQR